MLRVLYQAHGTGINQHVLQLHIGITLGKVSRHLSPQSRAFQHIGLINGDKFFLSSPGQLKTYPYDALNLSFRVGHGIHRAPATGGLPALFGSAEVEPAGKLTDKDEINPFHNFGFQV